MNGVGYVVPLPPRLPRTVINMSAESSLAVGREYGEQLARKCVARRRTNLPLMWTCAPLGGQRHRGELGFYREYHQPVRSSLLCPRPQRPRALLLTWWCGQGVVHLTGDKLLWAE